MPPRRSPAPSAAEIRTQWQAYLDALSPEARRHVRRLLAEIRALAPKATPVFSYRIPGYRFLDQPLLWAAGFTRHVSLYPITGKLQRANATALAGHKTAKGTVQFPLDRPLPLSVVRGLIRGRLAEVRRKSRTTPR